MGLIIVMPGTRTTDIIMARRECASNRSGSALSARTVDASCKSMLRALRHFLFLLVAFAIIGGTTSGFARSAQYGDLMVTADSPCGMAMMQPASDHEKPMMPCKGMTPDCIKQMGCIDITALPATRAPGHELIVTYSVVDYWSSSSTLASLDPEPEPIPPRTA
jgi:hypothetical protein